MGQKNYDAKVSVKPGILTDSQDIHKSYGTLPDALKREADCGCGIDCCDGSLKLRDQTTNNIIRLFFDNGSMKFTDLTTGVTKTVTAVADPE